VSDKDYYDEDEIIKSLVNDQTPHRQDDMKREQNHYHNRQGNIHVKQIGCGCFDTRKFLINFVIYSVVLMATAGFFPGFHLNGVLAAVQAAFILTLLNTFVKPLIVIFTFPITILTMGAFYLIINAMIIMMTASLMGDGFVINDFMIGILAATFISILQHIIKKYVLKVEQL